MKFQNAYEGVKKIFTAEILSLIASVCTTIEMVLTVVGVSAASNDSAGGTVAALGGVVVLGLGAMVLAVISFIFQLIGVNKASHDEPAFKIVLYIIFAGIALSVIGGAFSGNATVKNITTILSSAVNLAVTVFIIQGIKNLAARLNNDEVINKGDTIFKIIIASYALIIIAQIVAAIAQNGTGAIIALVFILIAGILSIVQYILYIIYLNKAKQMLAE